MILRSIEVKGWRCFSEEARLGPLNERLNVVHGPNGAGKSTLVQALVRGLFDNFSVGGDDAKALRPWGRSITPSVKIEFRHEGREYRLSKQFLDRPAATLERLESGAFRALAEGEAADNLVRRMLRAAAPGRGLAQVKNWGLAQALWTLQGDLNIELSGDTAADIRSMLGAQFAGPGGGRLEHKIEALYGQYFAKKGGVKKGQNAPEAARLEEGLAAAQSRLAGACEKLRQFDERSLSLEGVRAEKAQLCRDIDACNATLVDARRRAQQYAELSMERRRRESQARAAEAEYNLAVQQIQAIQDAVTELAKAVGECGSLGSALPGLRRTANEARCEAQRRKTALENLRGTQCAVDTARLDAAQASAYTATRLRMSDLTLTLQEVHGVMDALAAIRAERGQLVAPDAAALRAIRKAGKTRDDAQLRLEAALINIEIEPSLDVAVTVLEGEKPGIAQLVRGASEEFQGSPAIVLDIEGLGRLRARGPVSDAGELREQRIRAENKLARLTEPYGSAEIETLEKLSEEAAELDRRADERQARLDGLLAGKTAESLHGELSKHQIAAAEAEAQRPEWKSTAPDAAAMNRAALAIDRQFRDEVAGAERRWMDSENLASSAETEAAGQQARFEEMEKRVAGADDRLSKLRADGKTEAERDAERSRAALLWDAATENLRGIDAQLAGYADDPAVEAKRLERQLKALDKQERDALTRENREEGALSDLASQGPYRAVAATEEEVAALTARLERERSRMDAVELLWQTVKECRTQAVAAVAAPVESAATTMLHRIAGGRLGRIRLGEGLVPANLAVEAAESAVPLDNASGGEREQIFLATRLALADVLARDVRQLVLLDDVLTATDTARMARIMRLLEESADKVQVVILTCHPERYLALDGAAFFVSAT